MKKQNNVMKKMQSIFYIFTTIIATVSVNSALAQDPHCVYMASDVYPGSYGAAPNNYIQYDGAIYFASTGDVNGMELWKYEGGVSSLVADINPGVPGSMPNYLTVIGPYLYFSANNGVNGTELFRYDGTTVTMISDINPGVLGSFPNMFTVVGSDLYFVANNGSLGFEPYVYDGSTVSLIADINPGMNGSTPGEIVEMNGDIYYTAYTDANGEELWMYDGSTMTLFDIYPGVTGSDIGELTVIPGQVVFRATDGTLGYELMTCDGSNVTNLNVNPSSDFTPWELTPLGNEVYFRGFISTTGYELWKYDGTSASLVMDIRPGTSNSTPNNLTAVGSVLYFAAHDGTHGNELWMHDGVTTALAADIKTGSAGSMPAPSYDPFGIVGDWVFVVAENGASGYEVWGYDGTSAMLGKDIAPGATASTPVGFKGIGNILYFTADNTTNGSEMWAWDITGDLTDTIAVTTCDAYTSPAGNVYTAPGTYSLDEILPSVQCPGCDSLIHIDLIITDQPGSTQNIVACNEYTSPGGNYFGTVGTYNFTEIVPSISCPTLDSIITYNLTIVETINPAIVVFSGVLVAQQAGAIYQWLDCDNGYAPIPGATDQDFLPTVDGTYACEVTLGCTDTSNCYFVESTFGIGFSENLPADVVIYPNPAQSEINIDLKNNQCSKIVLLNTLGDTVQMVIPTTQQVNMNVSELSAGIYFISLETDTGNFIYRIAIR
ncbi:MAG: T9SS type A sorting domain-containing protein [Crocinitomicaceae bacterium]|nr:T9SS type A sorting domain-containing protein [Crocinitomicaceae bacterium]